MQQVSLLGYLIAYVLFASAVGKWLRRKRKKY
jgi:hypothetical protein